MLDDRYSNTFLHKISQYNDYLMKKTRRQVEAADMGLCDITLM